MVIRWLTKPYKSSSWSCCLSQVGHSGVDRASSSDARGPGFKPRPLRFKKDHFFTLKPYPPIRSRVQLQILELGNEAREKQKILFLLLFLGPLAFLIPRDNFQNLLSSSYRFLRNVVHFGNPILAPLCLFVVYFGHPNSPISPVIKKKSSRNVVSIMSYCVVIM